MHYPYYHPHRSRFFNTATLFEQTAATLIDSINEYLLQKWNIETKYFESEKMAYNNYVNWEESGGKDVHLPGFFLTNRRIFWVALAHKKYYKFYSHNKENMKLDSMFQHFHLKFKNNNHFREAYNCSDLTEDEKAVYKNSTEGLTNLDLNSDAK